MNSQELFWLSIARWMAILFVPLYPALFVMSKLPESSAQASGTLAGMKIKLAGGGAFYFVLLLLGWKNIPDPSTQPSLTQGKAYTVTGTISMEPLHQGEAAPNAIQAANCSVLPPWQPVGNGRFVLTVARSNVNGLPEWPTLEISAANYVPVEIDTEDLGIVDRNEQRSTINIKKPIVLKLIPPPPPNSPVTTATAQQLAPL